MIETQSLNESLSNLSHHGSIHSAADSMTEEVEPLVVKPELKKEAVTANSLSSYEQLSHQFRSADAQPTVSKMASPHRHTAVKEELKRILPEETPNISPPAASIKQAREESAQHSELLKPSPEKNVPTVPSPGAMMVISTTSEPEDFQQEEHEAPPTPPLPSSSPPPSDFINDHKTATHEDYAGTNHIDVVDVEEIIFSVPKSPSEQGIQNGTFDYTSLTEFTATAKGTESSKDEFSFLAASTLTSPSLPATSVCLTLELYQ